MMSAEGEESWLMKEGAWCFKKKKFMKWNLFLVIVQLVCGFFLLYNNRELSTVAQGVHYLMGLAFCFLAGRNTAKLIGN